MKGIRRIITSLLVVILVFAAACGKKDENQLVGTWEYSDTENGIGAIYVLNDEGTGTYTMIVGDQEVTYELKYEVKDGHLLVTFVNNEIFSEEDVFDSEFTMKDSSTMIIKDTSGMEMEFVKK